MMAPGPPKAIGKGRFTNGFTAMLLVERFEAGPQRELAGDGAGPPWRGDLSGHAGGARSRRPGGCWPRWRRRSRSGTGIRGISTPDETTWRVFCPGEDGGGPAKWWLWVFIGPDTVCFMMDPTRSGEVLARHAGVDKDTGQLVPPRGRRAAAAGAVD